MDIFGVVIDGIHIDVSKTVSGAKRYATINGFDTVTIRHRCGYDIDVIWRKENNKWVIQSCGN